MSGADALPLFVYGTLTARGPQAGLLRGLRRADARVRGSLWVMPAGYPALVPDGAGDVHGELVYGPSARAMRLIDHYEGVDEGLYKRVRIWAWVGLLQEPAWGYVMPDARLRGGRHVPSGRWRARGHA